jgi:HEAT repeats
MKIMTKLLLVPLVLLPACAATETGPGKGERDPAYEKERQARWDRRRKKRLTPEPIGKVLLDINVLLNDYFQARKAPGNTRVETHIVSVRKAMQDIVTINFRRVVIAAEDPEYGQNRGVALVALGFAEEKTQRDQALLPLLNAVGSKEQAIVSNACLGLGELKDNRTPPTMLIDLLMDPKRDKITRLNACWALTQLQGFYAPKEKNQLLLAWLQILHNADKPARPEDRVDPEILTSVVRAVGLFRNPDHARFMEPFCMHETPSVRMNAAIALGRMGNQESHKVLLKLILPAETNANVRLAARKALQALAGNTDGGYDVEKWKSIFTRQK